jgi:alkylhydroperoxidase family enzyme
VDVHGAVIETRYDELVERLRVAAQPGRPAPPAAEAYLAKVRTLARTVTDDDVAQLKAAGLSEDEIFEQTVAVAVAAGLARLDAALRVVR